MTDEERAKAHRAINLAQRAKQILSDELVIEARATVRASLLKSWEDSPARDSEGREKLYQMLKLHDRVWSHLEQVLQDGKVADSTLPIEERRGLLNF